jgi:hypothetical protein
VFVALALVIPSILRNTDMRKNRKSDQSNNNTNFVQKRNMMRQYRISSRPRICFSLFVLSIFVLFQTVCSSSDDNGYTNILVLVYETADSTKQNNYFASPVRSLINQLGQIENGIEVSVFGNTDSFEGYGSKFVSVLPVLKSMTDQETLVVITDSRDVLVNNRFNDHNNVDRIVNAFRWAFYELTMHKPSAIVVSAEAQCCVSALTHVQPGGYYNPDGSRKETACWSGKSDCLWVSDDNALAWEKAMNDTLMKQSAFMNITFDDRFLNAGLVAGKGKDLIRILEAAQIGSNEDDQAVLTDYMIQHPDDIVLDYGQSMFGNNRVGVQTVIEEDRCVFSQSHDDGRLVHTKTGSSPLFVHSPGGYYSCHDRLATMLNIPAISSEDRQSLQQNRDLQSNYKGTSQPISTPVSLGSLLGNRPTPTSAPRRKIGTSLMSLLRAGN